MYSVIKTKQNIKPTKRLRTTGAYENASRTTFVRPISVSHLGLFHACTIVSSRSQCYFSRISSNCTVIPYSIFPYLHFPTLLTRTLIFRTCVFHPCVAVLEFSVLEFSVLVFSTRTHFATLYFSFPYLHFPVLAISAPPSNDVPEFQFHSFTNSCWNAEKWNLRSCCFRTLCCGENLILSLVCTEVPSLVIFMPTPPPIDAAEALCFRVVCPCVRACEGCAILLARYPTNRWAEFHHQASVDDVVEATDELIRSRIKVKVTERSNIWVGYCGGGGIHIDALGVEVSSSFFSLMHSQCLNDHIGGPWGLITRKSLKVSRKIIIRCVCN